MTTLPPEALEDAGIVLGRRGAGKSNVLMTLFEQEIDAEHRAVMVDPKGDRWGIRLNPDGTPSRFTVPIFGGDHSDIPINEESGAEIGRLVAEHDLSCLIDLSRMSLQGKQHFMMGFAPALLEHNRAALTLFLEEVDQFANQDPRYQPPMLVHHIANFATLGRQRGIVPWVASQRPAKVNATVRSQADTFVAMKVTSPLDRKAYGDWFGGHSKEAAALVEKEAGSLRPGEALVWIGATEFFGKAQFPLASTYDSGRTPKHGERIADVDLPPIDLGAIRVALTSAEREINTAPEPVADRNDTALHARIADLEQQAVQLKLAAARAYESGKVAGISIGITRARAAIGALRVPEIFETGSLAKIGDETREGRASKSRAEPVSRPAAERSVAATSEIMDATAGEAATIGSKPINGIGQSILANLRDVSPARLTWAQAAYMVGRSPKSGAFFAAKKQLLAGGLVETEGQHVWASGPDKGGLLRADALAIWRKALDGFAPRMLDVLADNELRSRDELGAAMGVSTKSGAWFGGLKALRERGLLDEFGSLLRLAQPLPGESI